MGLIVDWSLFTSDKIHISVIYLINANEKCLFPHGEQYFLLLFIAYGAKYCPELKNPANGTVMQDKVFATYACLPHHRLKGSKIRVCNTENGTWQNEEPTCSAGELCSI